MKVPFHITMRHYLKRHLGNVSLEPIVTVLLFVIAKNAKDIK